MTLKFLLKVTFFALSIGFVSEAVTAENVNPPVLRDEAAKDLYECLSQESPKLPSKPGFEVNRIYVNNLNCERVLGNTDPTYSCSYKTQDGSTIAIDDACSTLLVNGLGDQRGTTIQFGGIVCNLFSEHDIGVPQDSYNCGSSPKPFDFSHTGFGF